MTNAKQIPHYLKSFFTFDIQVYEPGDDLCNHLNTEPSVADAFEALALQYEKAAADCRRIVGLAREVPDLRVGAIAHEISLYGPNDRFQPLVDEGLLRLPFNDQDRVLTENALREQFEGLMHGVGPFTVAEVLQKAAQIDTELEDLNPVWVGQFMDALVETGLLGKVQKDQYEVVERRNP